MMDQSQQSNITHQSPSHVQSGQQEMLPSSTQEQQIIQAPNQQERKRNEQIMKQFDYALQGFQQNSLNQFVLKQPTVQILGGLVTSWMNRPKKTSKLMMKLQLKNVDQNKVSMEIVQRMFKSVGSIKLIYNQKVVDLKSVFFQYGDYTYQGCENYMFILSEANKSFYQGQVKKINENQYRYHGKGRLLYGTKSDGFEYFGQFYDGKRHGIGRLITKYIVYQGEFKNDYKHGMGKQTIFKKKKKGAQGPAMYVQFVYYGQFKLGQRDGKGQQIKNGSYNFEGDWKKNQKCGYGKIKYKNQDSYEGDWQYNLFNGKGKYVQFENCTYEGQFKDGKYHGKGVMQYVRGDRYEGQFQAGKKHGVGKYDWKQKNGELDYYDGQWRNDSAEGKGSSMIQGQFYTGEFKNGKRHGEGQVYTVEGDSIRAIWDNGVMVKQIERNGQPVED